MNKSNNILSQSKEVSFKFGIAEEIITPPESMFPVKLQGFGARTELSYEVYDDIYVKTVLLSANKDLLLIVLDMTSASNEACDEIKSMVINKYPLKKDQIWVTVTHTHSSIGFPSNIDDVYRPYAFEKIIKAVDKCYNNLEAGSIHIAKGKTNAGVSRRFKAPDGGIKFAPNWNAEIDRDLFVIKLLDYKNSIKGILYNLGCHGTTLGPSNILMCNDFMGFTNKYITDEYQDAVSIFLPADGADVKPLQSAVKGPGDDNEKNYFIGCTIDQTDHQGKNTANEIINILKNYSFNKINSCFYSSIKTVSLFGPKPDINRLEEKLKEYTVILSDQNNDTQSEKALQMAEYGRDKTNKLIERIKAGNYNVTVNITFGEWYFGNNVKIISIACEPTSQLGFMIKKIFQDGRTLIAGYTNGKNGYIGNSVQHMEGGYEADSMTNRGLAGPLLAENDEVICNAVKALHFDLK